MADSTLQESLLPKIPSELMEQINAGPRDLYEKVHQRELLLIEQIKHFAHIRVEELANYSRNLLKQRQVEQEQRDRRESQPEIRPALKSIVKREPSLMEKRVSFSELPPEVEEFYSNNDDLYDSDDSDKRFDYKTIDTSSDDEEPKYGYVDSSGEALVSDSDNSHIHDTNSYNLVTDNEHSHDLDFPSQSHEDPTTAPLFSTSEIRTTPATTTAEAEGEAPHSPEPMLISQSPSPLASPPRLDLKQYDWTPSESEPVISFEDAYGDQDSVSEHDLPDFDKELEKETQTPESPLQKPAGFVGSAPINIGMEALILDNLPAINVGQVSDSSDLPEALNPENMSFSQRMAWEDRPRV